MTVIIFIWFTLVMQVLTTGLDIEKVIEEEIGKKVQEELLKGMKVKFHSDLDQIVENVIGNVRVVVENGTDYLNKKMEVIQREINTLKDIHTRSKVQYCMYKYQDLVNNLAEKGVQRFALCSYALIGQSPYNVISKIEELRHSIDHTLSNVNSDNLIALIQICGSTLSNLPDVLRCVISKSPDLKQTILDLHVAITNGGRELLKLVAHNAMHEACLVEVINQLQDEGKDVIVNIESCLDRFTENYNILRKDDSETKVNIPIKTLRDDKEKSDNGNDKENKEIKEENDDSLDIRKIQESLQKHEIKATQDVGNLTNEV